MIDKINPVHPIVIKKIKGRLIPAIGLRNIYSTLVGKHAGFEEWMSILKKLEIFSDLRGCAYAWIMDESGEEICDVHVPMSIAREIIMYISCPENEKKCLGLRKYLIKFEDEFYMDNKEKNCEFNETKSEKKVLVNKKVLYGLREAAKILLKKERDFLSFLKKGDYISYQEGRLLPTEKSIDSGLFSRTGVTSQGKVRIASYLTEKGMDYFKSILS